MQMYGKVCHGTQPAEIPHSIEAFSEGPVLDIEEEKDWTASGKISGLWPSAEYVYRLAYLNSTLLPYPETPISFKTFPDPRSSAGTHFKFLLGSCIVSLPSSISSNSQYNNLQLPNFPYNPAFPERIKGLDIISDYITSQRPAPAKVAPPSTTAPAEPVEEAESITSAASAATATIPVVQSVLVTNNSRQLIPEFMILAGDAIYADVPHYAGDDLEAYRKLYRRSFASPSYRKVYEKLRKSYCHVAFVLLT
jgi:alkaline phosphatase D